MQQRIRRAARVACATAVVTLISHAAQAVTLQSRAASARISSGNTTLVSSPAAPAATGPDDTTGFLQAEGALLTPPGPIDAGAISTFGLSNGILAAGGAFAGSANLPADARLFGVFGGASTTYLDELTVTSGSLANGTAVDVRFVFDLAFSASASVTDGLTSSANFARAAADVQATIDGSVAIDQNANRFLQDLENGTFIQSGLFTGPQTAEFVLSTTVGSTFQIGFVVDADTEGALQPNAGGVLGLNGAANAASFLALAFGAEAVGVDAAVSSALLGGAFPLASLVSPAAAQDALPTNPLAVPEPRGLVWLLLLGAAALPARRR